jgi:hypothetical protein
MQVRARVRFDSKYGPVRPGDIFTAEEGYVQGLLRDNLVTKVPEDLRPDRRQVIQEAPRTKKDESLANPPQASMQDDGPVKPLPSSRAGRASRRATRSTAGRAAK